MTERSPDDVDDVDNSNEDNDNDNDNMSYDDNAGEEDGNDRYFDTDNMTDLSLAELIHKQMERISSLEQSHIEQGNSLFQLQQELNEAEIKHKKEVYLLQMELDQTKREKAAGEERMGELYHDLMELQEEEEAAIPESVVGENGKTIDDPNAVAMIKNLNDKLQKYEKTFGVMDNQMAMIKTSCEQVVKTLKEEIADLMEDRCHMEIDLLNQVTKLEHDKETLKKLSDPESHIILEKAQSFRDLSTDSFEEKLKELRDDKEKLQLLLNQERQEADHLIAKMEESNQNLQDELKTVTADLTALRLKPDTKQTAQVLEKVAKERLHLANTLDELAVLWERADSSVLFLEGIVDRCQIFCEKKNDEGHEKFLTTLESAALVHSQVKISVLLLELKLRNQLTALSNDHLALQWTGSNSSEVDVQIKGVQEETLAALRSVQQETEEGLRKLEERIDTEMKSVKKSILQRTNTIQCIQIEHKKLQRDMDKLHQKDAKILPPSSPKTRAKISNPEMFHSPMQISEGESVLDQLQTEVLRTVERLKMKDRMILLMKEKIEESVSREQILKKELRRVMKKAKTEEKRKLGLPQAAASSAAASPIPGVAQQKAPQHPVVTKSPSRRSDKSSPIRNAASIQSGSSRDPPAA
jgi:hypothetical protein